MNGKIGILMVIAAFYPLGLMAGGICSINTARTDGGITPRNNNAIASVIEKLDALTPYSASVDYRVSLPQADDDIIYKVRISSEASAGDTLCEATYLIDWELPRPDTTSRGFSAYSRGDHYRFHDNKLQEYHYQWDSIPFLMGRGGVQRGAQFVELVPQVMARDLRTMLADTTFTLRYTPDTLISGRRVAAVKGAQSVRGYDGRFFLATFDRETGRPLRIANEYNPGQISEQSVEVEFNYPPEVTAPPQSEEELIALYPEVFEKYRRSNYRVENLRGVKLPHFSLPTLTAERYTFDPNHGFRAPAVVAIIDPAVATAAETVKELRKAVASSPVDADLLLVFTGGNPDSIEEIAGAEGRRGEYVLLSGRTLARDCGVTVFPTIIVADGSGTVKEVMLGFNRNLSENVIQAVALSDE